MELPEDVRQRFREHGRRGGLRRAERLPPAAREAVARRAATARWTRRRFGMSSFEALGLPGGTAVDAGLADLAWGRTTPESLVVSLAAPRLRREGVPVGPVLDEPERRLFELLSHTEGDLTHARYTAWLRQLASFADACRVARIDRKHRAT
jgi:anti-sigma-K factor RskA